MFEGVKETLCARCAHMQVCAYQQDYLDILKAIENADITRDTPYGKTTSKKVIHYDFISEISVGCKYYQNWTGAYRSEGVNL
mgnify:CR=1 FL=1|uniref:Uncharacterized protein n=1 Tax=Siphoviridae sp. ct9lR64 TaxID=2826178 RepID=A0A8S5QY96_9CAUD|nr:MAG TPA: hypothetical protein [Siphoviridae sp. ct9lR64]